MEKIIVEQVGEKEWCFKESMLLDKNFDVLHAAEELKDDGYHEDAIEEFRKIIRKVPECIEAYNDLYFCHLYLKHDYEAFAVLETAVNLFLPVIPEQFIEGEHCLPWVFLENRPFMRLYANLGLEYLNKARFAEAKIIFDRLLSWNPHDNQGMRENVIKCNLELKLFDDALDVCNRYEGDGIAGICYGRPLLLVIFDQMKEARKALESAIKYMPKIAKELLKIKHKPPKSVNNAYITLGGDDEAYLYWKVFGKYWNQAPKALALLKELSG